MLANGARLANNPLALLEEAREGVLYCAEIGQYSRAEQKGLAFLLPKLDKHAIVLVATSAEPLANLPPKAASTPALLSQLSAGAVMLPPLRTRRDDIPALIERFWRAVGRRRARSAAARGAVARRAHRAVERLLARQSRSPAKRRREHADRARRNHAPIT